MLSSLFLFANNTPIPSLPSSIPKPSSATAMKKLYRKGTVHPTPPLVSDHLAFLPAAILTLAAALCQEDKEVLAYLISCSSANFKGSRKAAVCGGADHPTCFNCNCFSCYMSYWVRWDSSPNRQLIHEIIDAYEDGLQLQTKKMEKNKREKRRNKANNSGTKGSAGRQDEAKTKPEASLTNGGQSNVSASAEHRRAKGDDDSSGDEEGDGGEKGTVRRIVSFLGERIWTTIWT